jgi:divalent metal cation (Fe/Co/Zn/Cd) transporter
MTAQTDGVAVSDRASLVRRAFWLEWVTVGWMFVEASVALATGLRAGSISLVAFGADSVIELLSAFVLIWRLSVELRDGAQFSEDVERRASRIGGGLLFALAAYVLVSAGWSLFAGHGQEFEPWGLAVTVASIPVMYVLARQKLQLADQLGSRAMRTDAVESITCGYLAVIVVVGLVAQLLTGFWWVDSVTSLGIVWFLVKEGREAWTDDDC